jgi:hypothetical protein
MTKPNKINGVSKALIEQLDAHQRAAQATCERKLRYADEFAARAIGGYMMREDPAVTRYVYKCKWCRGWHITKQQQPPYYAADYFEKNK